MPKTLIETVKDCHYPWTWMMITADGRVTPCCFASGHLGNLNEATAEAIWNGSIARELRQFIKEDRIHPVCSSAPCKFVQNSPPSQGGSDSSRPGTDSSVSLFCDATELSQENFDEAFYLRTNRDVAAAVAAGKFRSGWEHYERYGRAKHRSARSLPRKDGG